VLVESCVNRFKFGLTPAPTTDSSSKFLNNNWVNIASSVSKSTSRLLFGLCALSSPDGRNDGNGDDEGPSGESGREAINVEADAAEDEQDDSDGARRATRDIADVPDPFFFFFFEAVMV
jgi:hypothetical protein